MKAANQAFADGDFEKLKFILSEEDLAETINTEELEIERLNQQIQIVQLRIEDLRSQVYMIKKSDLYVLMLKVIKAAEQGRDLLLEMADHLEVQTQESLYRYYCLLKEYESRSGKL